MTCAGAARGHTDGSGGGEGRGRGGDHRCGTRRGARATRCGGGGRGTATATAGGGHRIRGWRDIKRCVFGVESLHFEKLHLGEKCTFLANVGCLREKNLHCLNEIKCSNCPAQGLLGEDGKVSFLLTSVITLAVDNKEDEGNGRMILPWIGRGNGKLSMMTCLCNGITSRRGQSGLLGPSKNNPLPVYFDRLWVVGQADLAWLGRTKLRRGQLT